MSQDEKIKELTVLIEDETEAIQGYLKAMEKFKDCPEIVSKLNEITDDEREHIDELVALMFKI